MDKDPTTVLVTAHLGGSADDVRVHEWTMDNGSRACVLHLGDVALHLTRTPVAVLDAVADTLRRVAREKDARTDSAPLRLNRRT